MRAILAAALLLTLPADWELLGSRRVSFTTDHDAIIVGAREGAYTAIKIDVAGGDLEMYNVKLTFSNGDTWSPNTRILFREGSWSRTIDLPGSARLIRRIDFWYRSRLRRGTATVHVFGRQAGAAPQVTLQEAAPPPAPSVAGWDHLAGRPVNFRVDHDVVPLTSEGRFRAVRFDVEGGNLEMYDVKLTFGNGETFSPATRLFFSGGTRTRVIDLPGDARIIRRIDFFYRSSGAALVAQGKTTVHVYGRR